MEANASVLEGWELDQLFKLRERQPDLLEPVVKRLVQENEDIRWSVVVGAAAEESVRTGQPVMVDQLLERYDVDRQLLDE